MHCQKGLIIINYSLLDTLTMVFILNCHFNLEMICCHWLCVDILSELNIKLLMEKKKNKYNLLICKYKCQIL